MVCCELGLPCSLVQSSIVSSFFEDVEDLDLKVDLPPNPSLGPGSRTGMQFPPGIPISSEDSKVNIHQEEGRKLGQLCIIMIIIYAVIYPVEWVYILIIIIIMVGSSSYEIRNYYIFSLSPSISSYFVQALKKLLFGDASSRGFNSEWLQQNLVFNDIPHLEYGLVQHKVRG